MVNKEVEKGIKFQKLNPAKKSNEGSSWGDNCIASPGSINPEGSSWLESGTPSQQGLRKLDDTWRQWVNVTRDKSRPKIGRNFKTSLLGKDI